MLPPCVGVSWVRPGFAFCCYSAFNEKSHNCCTPPIPSIQISPHHTVTAWGMEERWYQQFKAVFPILFSASLGNTKLKPGSVSAHLIFVSYESAFCVVVKFGVPVEGDIQWSLLVHHLALYPKIQNKYILTRSVMPQICGKCIYVKHPLLNVR